MAELLSYQQLLPEQDMDVAETPWADKTYYLNHRRRRIRGYVEGEDSLRQRIYKILATERGAFPIYSSGYGVAVDDLRGCDHDLAESELKRRIVEALEDDDEILAVEDFSFIRDRDALSVYFVVSTSYGAIEDIDWRFSVI
ncbi:MAG: DUF2634 domain-containing protein [Bacillota bacterium]|nr:DUF2634 domain-containing protein [Bacillota bacterium]